MSVCVLLLRIFSSDVLIRSHGFRLDRNQTLPPKQDSDIYLLGLPKLTRLGLEGKKTWLGHLSFLAYILLFHTTVISTNLHWRAIAAAERHSFPFLNMFNVMNACTNHDLYLAY